MASNKTSYTEASKEVRGGLGSILIGMIAAGAFGGALLVAGAKAFGEKLLERQIDDYERLERKRELDKELANRIKEIEDGSLFEAEYEIEEQK